MQHSNTRTHTHSLINIYLIQAGRQAWTKTVYNRLNKKKKMKKEEEEKEQLTFPAARPNRTMPSLRPAETDGDGCDDEPVPPLLTVGKIFIFSISAGGEINRKAAAAAAALVVIENSFFFFFFFFFSLPSLASGKRYTICLMNIYYSWVM